MASDMASRRLRKELMAIKRTPIDNIVVSAGTQVPHVCEIPRGLAGLGMQDALPLTYFLSHTEACVHAGICTGIRLCSVASANTIKLGLSRGGCVLG